MTSELISPAALRHVMRYVAACRFLSTGMHVLDAACGSGYGSAIIASHGCDVMGVDLDASTIKTARTNYPGIAFRAVDLLDYEPRYLVNPQDAIVSIETIEHFEYPEAIQTLTGFRKMLADKGMLVLSTPYCKKSGPSPVTTDHKHEYSLTDLELILNDCGFRVDVMELKRHEGEAGRLGYCMVKAVKK